MTTNIQPLKFKIGETVYLKTDIEQRERMITGYTKRPTSIIYFLGCGTNETTHYDIEISREKIIY